MFSIEYIYIILQLIIYLYLVLFRWKGKGRLEVFDDKETKTGRKDARGRKDDIDNGKRRDDDLKVMMEKENRDRKDRDSSDRRKERRERSPRDRKQERRDRSRSVEQRRQRSRSRELARRNRKAKFYKKYVGNTIFDSFRA